jgi:ABC-type lipoprotein release transport system permease subunit
MRPFGSSALRHARLQAVLAVAAIGAAVALPVVLVSVGGGVASHELHDLENSGYQIVVSAPGVHGIEAAHNLSRQIEALPNVAEAAPILSVAIEAFATPGAPVAVLAEGVVPGSFLPTLGPTERGLFPATLDLGDANDSIHFDNGTYAGAATYDVMVSSPYASDYGVGVGSTIELSPSTNASDAVAYNVTGIFGVAPSILQPTGANTVLLPLSDLQVLTNLSTGPGTIVPDAADTIEVVVASSVATSPAAIAGVAASIQSVVGSSYTVSTLSEEAQQLASANAVLTGFYLALSSVGLVVGWMFLAIVLLRRVEMDRRSIGIRRALGLPGGSIAVGFLRDGAVLAATGAAAGVGGGYLLVQGLARFGSSTVREAAGLAIFDPILLGEISGALVVLSLVASGIATRAALRVGIAEALR